MDRLLTYLVLLLPISFLAQNSIVKGRIVDTYSSDPLSNVRVQILSSAYATTTNNDGLFNFKEAQLPLGKQVLIISKSGYISQQIQIIIQKGLSVNLDPILMELDFNEAEESLGLISLSDEELDYDNNSSFNVSGLLSASKDVFFNAAAFDFSAAYFRPRGLDNANGKILINGIEMNKMYNGRPQWANFGGLNDVQRNREFFIGMKPNEYSFGEVGGTSYINMRASGNRRGGRVSYANSNKSYRGRIMGSYNSGPTKNGWAYSILGSRRYGDEGFQEGTFYDANSFFVAIEKKFSNKHDLNTTLFYTPHRRARATAITQEVMELKGSRYNPNWGYQEGEKRSSKVRTIREPVMMVNHYWSISDNTHINTNVCYQFGKTGNTRLDYAGNRNPNGNYYQRLPSYFLRNDNPTTYDYQLAYLAEKEFVSNGQLNWKSLYQANKENGNSTYLIQEDRVDDRQLILNTILRTSLSEMIFLNGTLEYKSLKSENFAQIHDLLGGEGYLDIDYFGEGGIEANSDLQNPNRIVQEGERYKYNYGLNASEISGFLQSQIKNRKMDLYLGLSASQSNYQRIGYYKNGYFPDESHSLGPSEQLKFTNFGTKLGTTYKINGRHLIDLDLAYFTKAPNMRSTFVNPRQNNDVVLGLINEKILSADIGYIYRSPAIKARLTGYYVGFKDQSEIGFFFTQNALGNDESSAFVQEIVTGIDKRNIGVEFGIEAQLLPTFKIKAAGNFGQNLYINNPNLYLAGDDFGMEGNDIISQGIRSVTLENYHVAGGPERVYQLGFEYRDSDFWWVGLTANYFSHSYVDISNLRRSRDFYTDIDGQPFNDYNEDIAKHLLQQEQLDNYILVNIVGGKSWRVKSFYVGFFATINNVLNQNYKTGGFEDSRRASYRQQLEEQNRNIPLFGNRYFFGTGTTYYANLYIRF